MKTTGKWLTWSGLLIAVFCVAVGVVLAVRGFSTISDVTDRAVTIQSAPTPYLAESGDVIVLYSRSDTAAPAPSCSFDPGTVEPRPDPDTSLTYEGGSIGSFAAYRATADGVYYIDCHGANVVAAPPVSVRGVLSGAGGVMLAVFGGGLGALLLIVGVILWIVGAGRARTAAQPLPGGYPPSVGGYPAGYPTPYPPAGGYGPQTPAAPPANDPHDPARGDDTAGR